MRAPVESVDPLAGGRDKHTPPLRREANRSQNVLGTRIDRQAGHFRLKQDHPTWEWRLANEHHNPHRGLDQTHSHPQRRPVQLVNDRSRRCTARKHARKLNTLKTHTNKPHRRVLTQNIHQPAAQQRIEAAQHNANASLSTGRLQAVVENPTKVPEGVKAHPAPIHSGPSLRDAHVANPCE